jgi:hypothetical protein
LVIGVNIHLSRGYSSQCRPHPIHQFVDAAAPSSRWDSEPGGEPDSCRGLQYCLCLGFPPLNTRQSNNARVDFLKSDSGHLTTQGPQGVVACQLRVSCGEGSHRRRRGVWSLGRVLGAIVWGGGGRAKIGLLPVPWSTQPGDSLAWLFGFTARQLAVAFPKALLSNFDVSEPKYLASVFERVI